MTVAPLGARADADGTDFAVFSSVAEAVDLCLFDADGNETRRPLEADTGYVWRGRVDGLQAGSQYGFRVHGPWDPGHGARCNPAKLLLDPYARAIAGNVRWHPSVFGEDPDDSAPYVPRSVVSADGFDWRGDTPPGTALEDSIIYELHVKGFTKLHPDVPAELRGTYRGLAHPAVIEHLTKLGVTAVELLPVHQFVHDAALIARGLRNYWGYQSIGYFAPHNEYASGDGGQQVGEFKQMVRALHAAGLEVILDVVFNHTAEGDEHGPTLCFRGLDNAAYYRLQDDPSHYVDDTGCGNTVDVHRPQGLRLIMDSLRYWVQEMHVDGFRFDLAASLGRGASDFDPFSAFLEAAGQDPVLAQVKLIAEPWDIGYGGYELGDFPPGWSEWNGRYRDTVRDFWRGTESMLSDFATRVTGSADLYARGRRPSASINLITVHDGFTLADLTSYDAKHNDANGEDNRDGTDDNRSWNCGAEGPTDDPGHPRPAHAPAPQHARDAVVVRGRPAAPRRRRARSHPGRQQQRLLPGQRRQLDGLVDRLRPAGAARVRGLSVPPATRHSRPAPPPLPAPGRARLVPAGRLRDDRRGLGRAVCARGRRGTGHQCFRAARQRLVGAADVHPPPAASRHLVVGCRRHGRREWSCGGRADRRSGAQREVVAAARERRRRRRVLDAVAACQAEDQLLRAGRESPQVAVRARHEHRALERDQDRLCHILL